MKKTGFLMLVLVLVTAATAIGAEFSADMITVMMGNEDAGKIYFKPPNISRNEAMGMVIITKPPNVYHLFQQDKKYVVTNIEEAKKQNPLAGTDNFEEWIELNNMEKVGTEKIQGFKCEVYEGQVRFVEGQPPVAMKFWYSKKLQYPLKNESTLQPPMGKVSSYLENIDVGRQPDSLFEVPAGYAREESMQKAMMGSAFQPPAGGAQGQPPTPAEREQMMKEMQEMMKKMQKP